jgi:hypothetical protein
MGQVIAETIRADGAHFWRALPLGLPLAITDQVNIRHGSHFQVVVYLAATPLFAAAFVLACSLFHGKRPTWTAFWVAVLVWLPFPVLRWAYLLPGLAWLALMGMSVPAALVEGLSVRSALARGRTLGAADYWHAFGSLAALVVVVGLAGQTLAALLHSQSNTGQRVAVFGSDLVLSPLLYLGGALLYLDQAARVGRPRRPGHVR